MSKKETKKCICEYPLIKTTKDTKIKCPVCYGEAIFWQDHQSEKKIIKANPDQVSKCCNSGVRIGGDGTSNGSTHWFICEECRENCDIVLVGEEKKCERCKNLLNISLNHTCHLFDNTGQLSVNTKEISSKLAEPSSEKECHCSRTSRYHTKDSNYKNHSYDKCWSEPSSGSWESEFKQKFGLCSGEHEYNCQCKAEIKYIKTLLKQAEEKAKAETIELCVKKCEELKNQWEDSLEWNFLDDLITTIKALDKNI